MLSLLAAPAVPTLVPPEGGEVVDAFSRIVFKIGAAASHGRMSVGQVRVPPGDGPPAYTDRADDELFIVHEGRFGFWDGAAWTEAEPGTVAFFPRGGVHTYRNLGSTPGVLWLVAGSGNFHEFSERCAAALARHGQPEMGRIAEICREHEIVFV